MATNAFQLNSYEAWISCITTRLSSDTTVFDVVYTVNLILVAKLDMDFKSYEHKVLYTVYLQTVSRELF